MLSIKIFVTFVFLILSFNCFNAVEIDCKNPPQLVCFNAVEIDCKNPPQLVCFNAVEIDCKNPPQLVDPTLCCRDGGRDPSVELCTQRMGLKEQRNNAAPSMETATCFAECILKQLKYVDEPEKLNYEAMREHLQSKYSNDTVYVETMLNAYRTCEPVVQQKIETLKQMPLGGGAAALRRGCSPFSGMLLGCTYMEYFKNCPSHRWTENEQCSLAKQFVTQCALGA